MIGQTIGPYRVVEKLGEGGMGEVYRAHDTKLNRDVALKLVPEALAGDPERLARFRREAQVLATLNHPNIAQIYGVEDSSSSPALVMELVPGRTLADVIRGGPTPWADAMPIARQIAEALESAHERGIIHRDLKPANIKVRDDGVVKVLDFGLAKAREPAAEAAAPGGSTSHNAATMTSPAMTEMGVILGTAAYMSPEQARGRPVDKRADIWAYGVVLVELLTGRTLFAGHSVTDTIAAVIKDDPDLDRLPADVPPAVRTLVVRCLDRDQPRRLRDIGEARILLSGPLDTPAPANVSPVTSRRAWWPIAGAAAIALAGLVVAAEMLAPAPAQPLRRFVIVMPAGVTDYALSHDASRLAYLSGNHLYVRRFDEMDARDLGAMHVTAEQPRWSPDDRTIAFTAESKVQSIPAEGGPSFVIADVPGSGRIMDLDWLPNGALVFSVWRDSIYGVPATGGTPVVRLPVDPEREVDFHHVTPLPDGRLIVATHRRQEDSDVIELVDLDGDLRRVLLTDDPGVSDFTHVEPGWLLFRRTTTNLGVWAVPFGDGPIDFGLARLVQAGAAEYTAARDGTLLALIPAPARQTLVWVDAAGAEARAPGDELDAPDPDIELSPDGRRAAFVQGRWASAGPGIGSVTDATVVVRDLETGVDTRLSVGASSSTMWGSAGTPAWFPDGQRLLHRTGRVEGADLIERRADIAGTPRVLTRGFQGRVLPDGRTLIYTRDDRGAGRLERAFIEAGGGTGPGQPIFPGDKQPDVRNFDVSADGRLIAYAVRQQNQRGDVFLSTLASPAEQWLVQQGGNRPRFSPDGSHLFFVRGVADGERGPEGQLIRVSIGPGSPIAIGPPVVVLRERPDGPSISTFDVALDGLRFLMWKPVPPKPGEAERHVFVENGIPERASVQK